MTITPGSLHKENGVEMCKGRIYIGDDFYESIFPSLDYWSIEDYERQWQEGVARLKTHDRSCLISCVVNPEHSGPLLDWWNMYRVDRKVYIYNRLFVGNLYRKRIGKVPFTPDNCYQFISDKPKGPCSEWVVSLG